MYILINAHLIGQVRNTEKFFLPNGVFFRLPKIFHCPKFPLLQYMYMFHAIGESADCITQSENPPIVHAICRLRVNLKITQSEYLGSTMRKSVITVTVTEAQDEQKTHKLQIKARTYKKSRTDMQ